MSQPVTTNPLIIMLINMTVVFLVLIALGLVINLIHMIDPTRPKEKKQEEAAPAAVAAAEPAPAVEPAADEKGISPEIVAVIAAAIASYGYGVEQIRAIRPIERDGWKNSGRMRLSHRRS
ncbi:MULTISPECIES: OadG family protein [Selenomonas]|uniref:Glutaconyl-CoA decarboxylase subunit delta n=1 Tax=Selenomonas ruminis TaxID=2593411 RepID=A0A5D6W3I4_9FIRM|nr:MULTISPECIES: OadG family protein [unclassified Selenomonas]MBQ1866923.1 OadG family protein [Selenomonas sp.]TYZ21415.1 glutaconyl-CoA decarboxylase subunit delta [Selenomonas sp. mPRGC5]